MLTDNIKKEIINSLKPLDLEKVILFGSYAYGSPSDDSDIDLYVVTKDDFIPNNFKEKMKIKLKVSKSLKQLKYKYDFDLIVHSIPMHEKFINTGSLFSKEIIRKGHRLI
jgi:predicted nucleotidyltransferase